MINRDDGRGAEQQRSMIFVVGGVDLTGAGYESSNLQA